jgi:hypothetical protein
MSGNPYPVLRESERQRFSADPRFRQRMRVIDIIAGAFIVAGFLYIGIVAAGLLRSLQAEATSNLSFVWQILVAVGALEPLALFLVAKLLIARTAGARDFQTASQQASALAIVSLAFAEAIVIYGLVTAIPSIGAPVAVSYGLMCYGIIVLVVAYAIIRPIASNLMLCGLAAEESGPR